MTPAKRQPSSRPWLGSKKGDPAPNAGRKYPPEPLTEAEMNQLLQAIPARSNTGVRNRALTVMLWRGGLRIAEVLALKPADVDPKRGVVRILHGKNDKARTVALDPGAMAVVERWIDMRKALEPKRGAPLFCTLTGTALSDRYVRPMLQRASAKAGIEKRVAPHQLRHSFAVGLVEEGAPVWDVQRLLGHASLDGTAHYLASLSPTEALARVRARVWEEPR